MAPAVLLSTDDSATLLTPSQTLHQLLSRDAAPTPTYNPGIGAKPPESFNNKAYFALFAILGAAMVIASIWFFFWAKDGGFSWEKGDWDDYKTTVLRRKGKDGKTLTNATPHTDLGEKSIAGTFDMERDRRSEMIETNDFARSTNGDKKSTRPHRHRGRAPSDEDLRAYRRERVARVGGLNRQEEGSHFDYSNASRSDLGSNLSSRPLRPKEPLPSKKDKKAAEKEAKKEEKQRKKDQKQREKEAKKQKVPAAAAKPPRSRHNFAADEVSVMDSSIHPNSSASNAGYHHAYRPPAPPHAASRRYEQRRTSSHQHNAPPPQSTYAPRPTPPRQQSPAKPASPVRRQQPSSYDAYSEVSTSDIGTKVYAHHIPQLSRGSRDTGFRRGGALSGRRDSLSDSDDGDMGGYMR